MDRLRAALGSIAFLVIAPGTVAGLLPQWITGWQSQPAPDGWVLARILGVALIATGVAALVSEFARFALQGIGTPAPIAPTRRLVVGGLYRYVRNPMYLAVIAILVGQTLLLASVTLFAYTVAVALTMAGFAHWYEEPALLAQHGAHYQAYRDTVPAWIPTLRGGKAGHRRNQEGRRPPR
jgi:protein-S-isoprenylcysteine O-methyltransferase Ste14